MLTHDEVAEKVGKPRTTISNYLRLLRLDPAVQQLLVEKRLDRGHGKVLLGVEADIQVEMAKRVVQDQLSVRQTEELIRKYRPKKENKLVFPTGFISTSIYIYILYYWEIYGDLTINIYYTIMSIYGWYMWTRINDKKQYIEITRTTKSDKLKTFGIFAFTSIFYLKR